MAIVTVLVLMMLVVRFHVSQARRTRELITRGGFARRETLDIASSYDQKGSASIVPVWYCFS